MTSKDNFVDILKPRNTKFGIIKFMTRSWMPKKTMCLDKHYTPQELKDLVANSVFMDAFLEAESIRQGVSKMQLRKEMLGYLNEIGFEKKLHIVRWVGMVFLKICLMMRIGVFVNDSVILKLKASMGTKPVLFLPTHRSYADFCLMTYLCFHYDIELPVVAAGMDFHSMAVVGQRMREMCAFYIRRTLVGAPVYAAALQQYVRTVLVQHAAPFEFFIEGTRSRSNKSLPPRLGMLSMALTPYFAREVHDMAVVPVSISYERLMELTLFAYEHLGVPKPRETTEGLLRSLQNLNDHFGNIYINLGAPISLNEHLGRVDPCEETLRPVEMQAPSGAQAELVRALADRVISAHQANTTVTATSLVAVVVMDSVVTGRPRLLDDVVEAAGWVSRALQRLGGGVAEGGAEGGGAEAVERVLLVHRRLFALDARRRLRLLYDHPPRPVTADLERKMKGHTLKAETMANAVPIIELQMYVNPVLHHLVPPAIIYLLARGLVRNKDDCYKHYSKVRTILRHEFLYEDKNEETTFKKAFEYCTESNVIVSDNATLAVGGDDRLQLLLQWALLPTLTALSSCMEVMAEVSRGEQKQLLKLIQCRSEERGGHPYSLSLEASANLLRGLASANVLRRMRIGKKVEYEAVSSALRETHKLIEAITPAFNTVYGPENAVIMTRPPVASRL